MPRWKHITLIFKTPCEFITQNFLLANVVDGSEIDIEEILSVVQSQIGRHGDEGISIEIELPNSKDKVTSCFERLLRAAKDLNAGISVHPALGLCPKDSPSEEKEFDGNRQSGSQSNSKNSREISDPLVNREIVRAIDCRIGKPDHTASKTILRSFSNLHVSEDPEKHVVKPTCLPLNIRQKDGCMVVNGDDECRFKPEDHCSNVAKVSFANICRLPGNLKIHREPVKVEHLEK